MTSYKGIAAVTQTLGFLAATAIRPAVPEARVTHERPEEPAAGSAKEPRLNIYLVQVVPDAQLRSHDLPTRTSNGALVAAPQAPVNLRYLLTFFGASQKAQLMLGAMEIALRARPVLDATLITQALSGHPELQDAGIAEQVPPVRIVPTTTSLEELSRFWSGFLQMPYTVSTIYEATTVILTSPATPEATLPVAQVGGGRATSPGAQLGPLPTVQFTSTPPGTTVPTSGRGLTSGTKLTLQGQELQLEEQPDGSLGFTIPADTDAIAAGAHPVTGAGSPQTLALRPELRRVRATSAGASVTVAPPVQPRQHVTLSLVALTPDPQGGLPSATLTQVAAEQTTQLQFDVPPTLPAGRYLALLEVDGVASLPKAVGGRYRRPSLELRR